MPMSFNSGREEISHSGAGATATTTSTPTVTNKPDINAFTTSFTQSVPTQSHRKFTSPRKLFFDDLLIPSLKFASAKTNQNNYTPFDHLVNCRNGSNTNINITSNNNRNNYNYKFSSLDSNHVHNLFRSDAWRNIDYQYFGGIFRIVGEHIQPQLPPHTTMDSNHKALQQVLSYFPFPRGNPWSR